MAPHFPARCTDCDLGVTRELGYEAGDGLVCPHCYRAGRQRSGVHPDPGLPQRS